LQYMSLFRHFILKYGAILHYITIVKPRHRQIS